MNENDKILGKTKEEMEEDNILELVKAMQVKQQCVEHFMKVVASFIRFSDDDFKKILADAASNLVEAHSIMMHHVKLIGRASKADVNYDRVELADVNYDRVELADDTELEA